MSRVYWVTTYMKLLFSSDYQDSDEELHLSRFLTINEPVRASIQSRALVSDYEYPGLLMSTCFTVKNKRVQKLVYCVTSA